MKRFEGRGGEAVALMAGDDDRRFRPCSTRATTKNAVSRSVPSKPVDTVRH